MLPRERTAVLVLVMVFVLVLTRCGTSADAAVSLVVMLLAALTGRAWPNDQPPVPQSGQPR